MAFTSYYRPSISRGTGTSWLNPLYWVLETRNSSQQIQDQRHMGADITVYHPAGDNVEFHYRC